MKKKLKTILITGATDGIGKATATELARRGHHVIIHGRNMEKAEKVRAEIVEISLNHNVDLVIANLLLLSEVKKMGEEVVRKYSKIDVLINNAGAVFDKKRETTVEGFEKTMTVNLFAPFLLTKLLLPLMIKSDAARIINLSSNAHKISVMPDLDDIQLASRYSSWKAYAFSKLYMIWLTQHLSADLKAHSIDNITANSLHPGWIKTDFGSGVDKGVLVNLFFRLTVPIFASSLEKGAATSVYLATSLEVERITGKYFVNKKESIPDQTHYSIKNEQKLWDYCMDIISPFVPSAKSASTNNA